MTAELTQADQLQRHIALCRLSIGGGYQSYSPEALHALADAVRAVREVPTAVADLLRTLAESRAIEIQGAAAAAAAEEPALHSPTAALFGQPVATLWATVMACLREHSAARTGLR